MSDDLNHDAIETANKVDTVLRIAVLGALYAVAILVVVAFSPSMGLVQPHPTGEVGRVASADEPVRR